MSDEKPEQALDDGTWAKKLRTLLWARAEHQNVNAMAKEAGVPQPVLYRFMHGERTVQLETAERLFKLLGYEVRKTK